MGVARLLSTARTRTPKQDDPVQRAVTLDFLRKFHKDVVQKGWSSAGPLSTGEVVAEIIKRQTEQKRVPLTELESLILPDNTVVPLAPNPGPPDYYISHAWSARFNDTVELILGHLSGAPPETRIWMDIFAINQHISDGLAFEAAINISRATFLVVDDRAECFKRSWCLHEMEKALKGGRDSLIMLHKGLPARELAQMYAGIDASNASCTELRDKLRIEEDIAKNHPSIDAFTQTLKLHLLLDPISQHSEIALLNERSGGAASYDFGRISEWILDDWAPRAATILAGSGAGKSSIAAALCASERNKKKNGPEVTAAYFVRHDDQKRRDPVAMLKTIAFQLATKLPKLREYYCGLPADELLNLRCGTSSAMEAVENAARVLLAEPFARVPELKDRVANQYHKQDNLLIVIDGLDEADPEPEPEVTVTGGKKVQPVSVKGNRIVACIEAALAALPPSVRILVTATPEALHGRLTNVMETAFGKLTHFAHEELLIEPILSAALIEDRSLLLGIKKDSPDEPKEDQGMLVYHVVAPLCGREIPVLRAPPTLEDLDAAFACVFRFGQTHPQKADLLACIVAAEEPLPMVMVQAMGLGEAWEALPGRGILFYERDYRLLTLHKSLVDWLRDKERSRHWSVNVALGHERLARFLAGEALQSRLHAKYRDLHLVPHLSHAPACTHLLEAVLANYDYVARVVRASARERMVLALAYANAACPSVAADEALRWLRSSHSSLGTTEESVLASAMECPWNTGTFRAASRQVALKEGWAKDKVLNAGGREGMSKWGAHEATLHGHAGRVNSVAWSPDGSRLVSAVSADKDSAVYVWRADTGEHEATLLGHQGAVNSVAWSPDGSRIASGGDDRTVQMWRADTGERAGTLTGHEGTVTCIAWSPDGSKIVSGGDDESVRVWQLGSEEAEILKIFHGQAVLGLAWSPDGKRIVSAGGLGRSLRIWNAETGTHETTLQINSGTTGFITTVAWSPNGSRIVAAGHDSQVYLWRAENGRHDASLSGHAGAVHSVAWSPDGERFVSAGRDTSVRVWRTKTGEQEATLLGHRDGVQGVAWSPDGSRIVSAGGTENSVRVWRPDNGDSRNAQKVQNRHRSGVWSVAWSPDGSSIVTAGGEDRSVRVWQVASGTLVANLTGHRASVLSVAWSPDGSRIISGGEDFYVCVWSFVAEEGQKPQWKRRGWHYRSALAVGWNPDGGRIVLGGMDKCVCVWRTVTGNHEVNFDEATNEEATMTGHGDIVRCVAWSPDGAFIASGGNDKTVRLWNPVAAESEAVLEGHEGHVLSVGWKRDNSAIVSAGADGTVRIWRFKGEFWVNDVILEGHDGAVNCAAWSHDGARIVSGGDDTVVRVWNVETREQEAQLRGHSGSVTCVAWRKDGRRIVSSGLDSSMRVWRDASD